MGLVELAASSSSDELTIQFLIISLKISSYGHVSPPAQRRLHSENTNLLWVAWKVDSELIQWCGSSRASRFGGEVSERRALRRGSLEAESDLIGETRSCFRVV